MGRRVEARARRQGNVISATQLRGLGVDKDRQRRLVAGGWLIGVHRGVYRVGAPTADGLLFAAVLAMGPGAVISHRSAAHVLGLLRTTPPAVVDVTSPSRRRPRVGVRPHRAVLHAREVTTRGDLPVTTVARTLLDLAADEPLAVVQAAVDEARVRRVLRRPAIEATIGRANGHRGVGRLRQALAACDRGSGAPIGAFERRAIAFLRDHDLPPYERNLAIEVGDERFTVDVAWRRQRVALELDGRAYHDNDLAFATDRRRSRRLAAAGWHVVRATWEDLDARPQELAADLRTLLGRR